MLKKTKVINDFDKCPQSYFNDINDFNPLSREEEYSLWERYKKNNDMGARDKLIKSNLKFVCCIRNICCDAFSLVLFNTNNV